jgi:hypothetical protein
MHAAVRSPPTRSDGVKTCDYRPIQACFCRRNGVALKAQLLHRVLKNENKVRASTLFVSVFPRIRNWKNSLDAQSNRRTLRPVTGACAVEYTLVKETL